MLIPSSVIHYICAVLKTEWSLPEIDWLHPCTICNELCGVVFATIVWFYSYLLQYRKLFFPTIYFKNLDWNEEFDIAYISFPKKLVNGLPSKKFLLWIFWWLHCLIYTCEIQSHLKNPIIIEIHSKALNKENEKRGFLQAGIIHTPSTRFTNVLIT